MMDLERLLPKGYRFRFIMLWWPTRIAGRLRWLERVGMVQREPTNYGYKKDWADIGFLDDVYPAAIPCGEFE